MNLKSNSFLLNLFCGLFFAIFLHHTAVVFLKGNLKKDIWICVLYVKELDKGP